MYNKENPLESIRTYLTSTNSRYNLLSIQTVVSIINDLLDNDNKLSVDDIIFLSPPTILTKFGYLWNVVLQKANIETWNHFGEVVFTCVDLDILKANEEDKIEKFYRQEKKVPLYLDCSLLEEEGYITSHLSKLDKNVD